MSTQNDFSRTFQANTAMSAMVRVSVSSNGYIEPAGLGVLGVGVVQEDVNGQSYDNPKVRLWGTGTMVVGVTGLPVTAGNVLYAVTGGLVAPTSGAPGGQQVGVALETISLAAASNGVWIEIDPQF